MIKNPIIIYYQRILRKDTERENLESNVKLRLDLELKEDQLMPITSFYCEKKLLLGASPGMCYKQLLCHHNNLLISYYDVYQPKKYRNLLYEEEKKLIEIKKSLKLERGLFHPKYMMFNKILLGTTMMPCPIGEYLLESVILPNQDSTSKKRFSEFKEAWQKKTCLQCIKDFKEIKNRRIVEQYLFLKYQTQPSSRLFLTRQRRYCNQ